MGVYLSRAFAMVRSDAERASWQDRLWLWSCRPLHSASCLCTALCARDSLLLHAHHCLPGQPLLMLHVGADRMHDSAPRAGCLLKCSEDSRHLLNKGGYMLSLDGQQSWLVLCTTAAHNGTDQVHSCACANVASIHNMSRV